MSIKNLSISPRNEELMKFKISQSSPFFRSSKVLSCSKVLVRNGRNSVAIGFPLDKTGFMAPGSYANFSRSPEAKSFSQYILI